MDPLAADSYFQTRINSEKWFQLTLQQKQAALTTADSVIESLPIKPRANPLRIIHAKYEQALFMAKSDVERRAELQAQGLYSKTLKDSNELYRKMPFGFPLAPMASHLLRGCFRVTGSVVRS